MIKRLLMILLLPMMLQANEANRILFLMQAGHSDQSLELYQQYYIQNGEHHFDLIQKIALALLEEGSQARDPESQLLSLYGAGISLNDQTLPILESGLSSSDMQTQLVALNYLSRYQNDDADEALMRSMASNNLLIRLEAGYQLALKQHPSISGQLESLMYKIPPPLLPLFPQLFAVIGNDHAIQILRRLMIHPMEAVRIESILHAAKNNRDDLLPQIRTMATHQQPSQQEAAAMALGRFRDESSVSILKRLSQSPTDSVKLSALYALYNLGRTDTIETINEMALKGNPFAITLLGEIPNSEDALVSLLHHKSCNVRVNAALALLALRDERCLPIVKLLLIKDYRDLAVLHSGSIGNGLSAWKVIPSASENMKDHPLGYELCLSIKEKILQETIELDPNAFIVLATALFQSRQTELVPTLVHLLENMHSPKAIDLLKKHQQMVGAPLIRNYCNLALFRLKEPGPYAANLKEWILNQSDHELIKFRALLPRDQRETALQYDLTPKETSRLLIESYQSLALSQNEDAINVLLNAIQYGNEKNKYTLAGLLIRALQ